MCLDSHFACSKLSLNFIIVLSLAGFRRSFVGDSRDAEKQWCMVSETADFYVPTLNLEDLIPYDKERKGLRLKMLLYALDEISYVFQKLKPNDVDRRRVLGYEILSPTLLCCMERHNVKPIHPHMMRGVVSTMMDVDDEARLERLACVVYNGVLLLGDMPLLSRQHSLNRILSGTCRLIYRGEPDSEHCPISTISSSKEGQAAMHPLCQICCTGSSKSCIFIWG